MREGSQRFGRRPEKHQHYSPQGENHPTSITLEMDSKMKTQGVLSGAVAPYYLADDFVCSAPHIILVSSNNLTHTPGGFESGVCCT
jgi:hypothetical protein